MPVPGSAVSIALSLHGGQHRVVASLARRITPDSVLVRRGNRGPAPCRALRRTTSAAHYVRVTCMTRNCARRRVPVFLRSTGRTGRTVFGRRPFGDVGSEFGMITMGSTSLRDNADRPNGSV